MCTYISYKSAHKKNDWATQRYIHNHTEINTKQTKERKKKGGEVKEKTNIYNSHRCLHSGLWKRRRKRGTTDRLKKAGGGGGGGSERERRSFYCFPWAQHLLHRISPSSEDFSCKVSVGMFSPKSNIWQSSICHSIIFRKTFLPPL